MNSVREAIRTVGSLVGSGFLVYYAWQTLKTRGLGDRLIFGFCVVVLISMWITYIGEDAS